MAYKYTIHFVDLILFFLSFTGKTGSGKTTLFRQLQIIYYGDEYSDDEAGYFQRHVYKEIVHTIQALIYSMKVLNIQFQDDKNLVRKSDDFFVCLFHWVYIEDTCTVL
jgi:hypothetical protein